MPIFQARAPAKTSVTECHPPMSRRFHFSLRTIFALTALVAGGCLAVPFLFDAIRQWYVPTPVPPFTDAELAQILDNQSLVVRWRELSIVGWMVGWTMISFGVWCLIRPVARRQP